ncbi:hypothetical protein CC99x_006590 [Candidatus Berkiella cookevillensis]|uniref:Uncharacterized protein n=1 Tax=Candidatus Berkiella cookevillensis TaxID=437022 RepID=A0A0Q9YSC0_9GAMM|nr:hypothetical protein [Candidatus Berkiella cookevillensis]MCS5708575.1 hypothetical protein [Candidatus Berkiella cookevillensis]
MATAGPTTEDQAKTTPVVAENDKKKNRGTVGLAFGVATAAIVFGLTLASGGAALSAAFLIKSLFVSSFVGLLFGAMAESIANGELKSSHRVMHVRKHHIGIPVPPPTKTRTTVYRTGPTPIIHHAKPTATVTKTTVLNTGPAKTYTPGHRSHTTTMRTTATQPTTMPSSKPHAAHRPAMRKSNHG